LNTFQLQIIKFKKKEIFSQTLVSLTKRKKSFFYCWINKRKSNDIKYLISIDSWIFSFSMLFFIYIFILYWRNAVAQWVMILHIQNATQNEKLPWQFSAWARSNYKRGWMRSNDNRLNRRYIIFMFTWKEDEKFYFTLLYFSHLKLVLTYRGTLMQIEW
jgi:hypothetical protein